jgi:hypothetical protein
MHPAGPVTAIGRPDVSPDLVAGLLAANAVHSDRARRDAVWSRLSYAALFGERSRLEALAERPEALSPGDCNRQARVGSLLLELGRVEAAEALLLDADCHLARFHLWRLARREGDARRAQRMLLSLPAQGAPRVLRLVATLEDEAGSDRARELCRWWGEANAYASLPAYLTGEMLLFRLRGALAVADSYDAYEAARLVATPPERHGPDAIVRATATFGSLPIVM